MTRPDWVNLNGIWDYAILPKEQPAPETFDRKILVPYCVESELSGVQKPLIASQRLWYRRSFGTPLPQGEGMGVRALLHFGAVDDECDVWVNGKCVGGHRGGYLPFTFDITDALVDGDNELIVSVWDPTDTGLQQRGKQVLNPKGIWYTSVSGIWQTVWLEVVPEVSIESLKLTPDLDSATLTVEVKICGVGNSLSVVAEISSSGERIFLASGQVAGRLRCEILNPRVWTPDDPYLYDLRIQLIRDGQVVDEVGVILQCVSLG
jgi:beta-galactosidase/beta-glucuronidase